MSSTPEIPQAANSRRHFPRSMIILIGVAVYLALVAVSIILSSAQGVWAYIGGLLDHMVPLILALGLIALAVGMIYGGVRSGDRKFAAIMALLAALLVIPDIGLTWPTIKAIPGYLADLPYLSHPVSGTLTNVETHRALDSDEYGDTMKYAIEGTLDPINDPIYHGDGTNESFDLDHDDWERIDRLGDEDITIRIEYLPHSHIIMNVEP